jgi:hypothetical protein
MRAANWGVLIYILAAAASVSIPLALVSGTVAALFPQAGHQDLLSALQAVLPTQIALH